MTIDPGYDLWRPKLASVEKPPTDESGLSQRLRVSLKAGRRGFARYHKGRWLVEGEGDLDYEKVEAWSELQGTPQD